MTVRVLRVMEYTYRNAEKAAADMEHWKVQGELVIGPYFKIVSRSFPMEFILDTVVHPRADDDANGGDL